ncbi:LxmA leader domain family RiPP, partial [Micromonospora sp. CPCC 206060]|uniref:LxmA leader domain family RiPP n=1 Tax=Micromonospora sp. CPCC 206060 TaxID=3122406 RepID=UPI002FF2C93A
LTPYRNDQPVIAANRVGGSRLRRSINDLKEFIMADEKLMDGYQSYTDAEELAFEEAGDSEAPTTPGIVLTVASLIHTIYTGC